MLSRLFVFFFSNFTAVGKKILKLNPLETRNFSSLSFSHLANKPVSLLVLVLFELNFDQPISNWVFFQDSNRANENLRHLKHLISLSKCERINQRRHINQRELHLSIYIHTPLSKIGSEFLIRLLCTRIRNIFAYNTHSARESVSNLKLS